MTPDDAPDLNRQLLVYEPAFRETDGDSLERFAAPLRAAGVKARINGLDIGPGWEDPEPSGGG